MTQKRLAELLGVDRTTVTKALADNPTISADLRARVRALGEELGYRPNYHSRSLRTRETKVISVLKLWMGMSYLHSMWISAVHRWAYDLGYAIRFESAQDIDRIFAEQSADGFISFHGPADLRQLQPYVGDATRPVVFTDCGVDDFAVNSVAVDNKGGMAQAVEHLVSLGHRQVAFFGFVKGSSICRDRLSGCMAGLNDDGLAMPNGSVIEVDRWPEEPAEVEPYGERLSRLVRDGVTAVVAASDVAAVGVVKCLRRQGVRVPEDVSVVGCDDSLAARVCEPMLTSVAQDVDAAAREAVHMLLAMLRTGQCQENVVVPARLVVRESTQAAGG